MTIRLAIADDAATIVALLGRLADETGDGAHFATNAQTIRAHGFGQGALFETLIAEQDGRATGIALFFRHFSTTRGQPGVYVQDLWTAPDLRGQGLGTRLLAAVARYSRAGWGACYLALTSHRHNDVARAFYAGLGFAATRDDVPMTLESAGFAALCNRAKAAT